MRHVTSPFSPESLSCVSDKAITVPGSATLVMELDTEVKTTSGPLSFSSKMFSIILHLVAMLPLSWPLCL